MIQDKARDQVVSLLKAKNSLIWLRAGEELRPERALVGVASSMDPPMDIRFWDCADGIMNGAYDPMGSTSDQLGMPLKALDFVQNLETRCIYVFRDLHRWTENPAVLRKLKSLARRLQGTGKGDYRAIVVLTPPAADLPPDLTGVPVIDWPLPDRPEMDQILTETVGSLPPSIREAAMAALEQNGTRQRVVDAAMGLTAEEASNAFFGSAVVGKVIDPALVATEKKQVIARDKVLTWFDPDPRGLDSIGGLDQLKAWLTRRKKALTAQARERGVPHPKGVLLVGISGTGKSQAAKSLGTAWGIPTLRLDLGALRSKYVGESEGNIRRALQMAQAISPCILWADEIEKSLAGSQGEQGDGGVSADALGQLLSWMQDNEGGVFVVATANDATKLPPEFMRKGRFDRIFFLDVPQGGEETLSILRAALARHDLPDSLIKQAGQQKLEQGMDGFVGAEIEQVVVEALNMANEDDHDVTAKDLVAAIEEVKPPLSVTAKDKFDALRKWAEDKAKPASSKPKARTSTGRSIEA